MVHSVLFLLLCAILDAVVGQENYRDHTNEGSPRIHYKLCATKYNCIVPSKYFTRENVDSLVITKETGIEFKDGLEIHVNDSSTWFLTLMSNKSGSHVEFTWGDQTMLKCNKDIKEGDLIFDTPHATIKAEINGSDVYDGDGGKPTPGIVCKYALKRKADQTRPMAAIFGVLVGKSRDQKMCIKVTKEEEADESHCSFIDDLQTKMRLAFSPRDCSGCPAKPPTNLNNDETLMKSKASGCEFYYNTKPMLVNDQFYTVKNTEIQCKQRRWVMKRYHPNPPWSNPYDEKFEEVDVIESVKKAEDGYNCFYSSPLKNLCPVNRDCKRITDWTTNITCPQPWQLVYLGTAAETKELELDEVKCDNATGLWIGYGQTAGSVHTLRAGESLVCMNKDDMSSLNEADDFLIEETGPGKEARARVEEEGLRRDAATDFTGAIVMIAAVAVISIVVVIVACIVLAACVGPFRRKPVGLQRSERSQRPKRPAGEEEMSFSDRLSLALT